MKKNIGVLIMLIFFYGINSAEAKIKIFTSIQPLAFFIEKIGGEKVEANVMLREGDNPHTFEPLPSQLIALSDADIYIKLGSGIEFENIWMKKIIKINSAMTLIDAGKNVRKIKMTKHHHPTDKHTDVHNLSDNDNAEHKHHSSDDDPHIWLSINNAIIMVENIREGLNVFDAENKEYYSLNAEKLILELKNLKTEISEKINEIKNKKFMIFHPSFGYFADEFNLIQVPVETDGKEPSPRQLKNLIKKARMQNIKVVFASENFSRKNAEVIAKEIKGKVLLVNELSKDYINNMKKISGVFLESL